MELRIHVFERCSHKLLERHRHGVRGDKWGRGRTGLGCAFNGNVNYARAGEAARNLEIDLVETRILSLGRKYEGDVHSVHLRGKAAGRRMPKASPVEHEEKL